MWKRSTQLVTYMRFNRSGAAGKSVETLVSRHARISASRASPIEEIWMK